MLNTSCLSQLRCWSIPLLLLFICWFISTVALTTAVINIIANTPTAGGTTQTSQDYGIVSGLVESVLVDGAPIVMADGIYYRPVYAGINVMVDRSITNNTSKFFVSGIPGFTFAFLLYTPNFTGYPVDHRGLVGTMTVSLIIDSDAIPTNDFRCGVAYASNLGSFLPMTVIVETKVRVEFPTPQSPLTVTIPFTLDVTPLMIDPFPFIAIFPVILATNDINPIFPG